MRRKVIHPKNKVTASVSATPAKDRLWDLIEEGAADDVFAEIISYISDDQAKNIWESITGYSFDDDNEDY